MIIHLFRQTKKKTTQQIKQNETNFKIISLLSTTYLFVLREKLQAFIYRKMFYKTKFPLICTK